ncbi:hypothetical protein [Micromonospora mirobrigensis]|nr:hypothetical protein [Micromonospora mirobrigensis]
MTKPRRRLDRRTVLVAVGLAVGLPAAVVALMALDGREVGGPGLLTTFLLTLMPAALGTAIALEYGRRRPGRLGRPPKPGDAPEVRQALGAGHSDDPRVDALARKEAERRLGERWILWLLGAGVLLEVLLVVGATRPSSRVVAVLLAAFWGAAGWRRWRGLREARAYLAAPAQGVAATPPVESAPEAEHRA